MAKLKLSGLLTGLSGKLGGSIFGSGANGNYMRQNAYSQQPSTVQQQLYRNRVFEVSEFWRSLTPTQQQAWINEAPNYPYINNAGSTVEYTGYQLMLQCNQNRLLTDNTKLDSPGTTITPVNIELSPNSFFASGINIDYSSANTSTYICYYASKASTFPTKQHPSKLRFLGYIETDGANGQDNIKSIYVTKFSYPAVGEFITVMGKGVHQSTGIPTEFTDTFIMQRTS